MLYEALAYYRKDRFYDEPNTPHPFSLTHGMLGLVYAYLGDLEQALVQGEQALAVAQQLPVVAFEQTYIAAHYRLGVVQLYSQRFEAAHANFSRSLELAQRIKMLKEQREALTKLGEVAFLQGQWEEAQLYYEQAIDLLEDDRRSLGITDWTPMAFHYWMAPYRALVRSHLAEGNAQAAFLALERTRARHLQDRRLQNRLLSVTDLSMRTAYDSLTAEIIAVQSAIGSERESMRRSVLQNQLVQLIEARRQLIQLPAEGKAVDLDLLQRTLAQRDQVMLSFFLDDSTPHLGRESYSTVFLVTPDTLMAVPLEATVSSTQALMRAVSPILLGQQESVEAEATFFRPAPLHALYQDLLAPVMPSLNAGTRLVILPDGPLFSLPFNMLLTEPLSRLEYEQGAYLLYQHATSTDISAQLYLENPPDARSLPTDLVVVGKEDFTDIAVEDAYLGPVLRTVTLGALPHVEQEVQAVRKFGNEAASLLNDTATESSFFEVARSARVVHLSTHAFTHPHSASHHAILLTPDEASDGVLYLYELERMAFEPDLVVLSGCGTAKGQALAGEGLASFQYAFRTMGAKRTLGTLWLVEDAAMSQLMTRFYEFLSDGEPPDVALQRAQQVYLRDAKAPGALLDFTSPFFWAAPVFYGSVDPVPLQGRTWMPSWLWRALLALLVFLGVIFLTRRFSSRSV